MPDADPPRARGCLLRLCVRCSAARAWPGRRPLPATRRARRRAGRQFSGATLRSTRSPAPRWQVGCSAGRARARRLHRRRRQQRLLARAPTCRRGSPSSSSRRQWGWPSEARRGRPGHRPPPGLQYGLLPPIVRRSETCSAATVSPITSRLACARGRYACPRPASCRRCAIRDPASRSRSWSPAVSFPGRAGLPEAECPARHLAWDAHAAPPVQRAAAAGLSSFPPIDRSSTSLAVRPGPSGSSGHRHCPARRCRNATPAAWRCV